MNDRDTIHLITKPDLPVRSDRGLGGWRRRAGGDTFGFLDENRSPGRIPCGGTPAGAEEEEEGGAASASAAAAAGNRFDNLIPGGREAARRPEEDVKMGLVFGLLWLFTGFLQSVHGQGVYVCTGELSTGQGRPHGAGGSPRGTSPRRWLAPAGRISSEAVRRDRLCVYSARTSPFPGAVDSHQRVNKLSS
ncbi:hypothetical protein D9C73_020373 [Collichthys lucidus]|uniref:Uncharacterized protein n=1 Tax=Collichthys lucidus TaxID=240159 RepID=A0A4U5VE43_COLLU|nr:hypothetical protein D9C73_020373 [Collichthys lucidus]